MANIAKEYVAGCGPIVGQRTQYCFMYYLAIGLLKMIQSCSGNQ